MTDNRLFIHRIGRGMSIEAQSRNARRFNRAIAARALLGTLARYRYVLLALLVALLAVAVWLICVSPALSATQPPTRYPVLCHRSQHGVRVQFFTLGSTWRLHRWGHDDEPATWDARRNTWSCK